MRQEAEKKLQDQRTQYLEKTKSLLHFEPIPEEKATKSGGSRGRVCSLYL